MKKINEKVLNVVINEQHTLLEDQERIIKNAGYDRVEFVKVSADGWDKSQMDAFINSYNYTEDILFVSPIGYMIKHMSSLMALKTMNNILCGEVIIMCNDRREKKRVAKWQDNLCGSKGGMVSWIKKRGTVIGGSDSTDVSYLRILTEDGLYHNKHYFANAEGYKDVLECIHVEAAENGIIIEPMTINFH